MTNEIILLAQLLATIVTLAIGVFTNQTMLQGIIFTQGIIANIFATQQAAVCGLLITPADIFTIGAIAGMNLIQELYGYESAKQTSYSAIFISAIFVLQGLIQAQFISIASLQGSLFPFKALYEHKPRIVAASLLTMLFSQWVDRNLFAFFTKKLPQSSFSIRSSAASIIAQIIDTIMFTFLGLYGVIGSLPHVISFSIMIKVITIIIINYALTFFKKQLNYDS